MLEVPTDPAEPFRPASPRLSIVIPIYNEEKRIGPTVGRLLDYLKQQDYSREIILVDDGSSDRGIERASQALEKGGENCRVVSYGQNRGKGYAIRAGMIESRGEYVLFTDADLSTPVEELDKMWPFFEAGYDIVQGSRKMPGASVELHQPWLRENMGKVFTALSNLIARVEVSDVTCGFKAYRGPAAHHIYSLQRIFDWSFDAEVIHIARRHRYRLKEIPVRWHDERGTKVHLVRDTLRSLQGLFRIRFNSWRGFYNQPPLPAPYSSETPRYAAHNQSGS